MTTRVLIVEDEADAIEELRQVFAELPGPTELRVAGLMNPLIFAGLEKARI